MGSSRGQSFGPLWFQGQDASCSCILTVVTSRYEYDDHYFLTDPKEFIYEFFPLQPEWQLLKEPINLEEFEELPFVRSLFFRYQLAFPTQYMKSVMSTDQTGEKTSKHHSNNLPPDNFQELLRSDWRCRCTCSPPSSSTTTSSSTTRTRTTLKESPSKDL